MEKYTKKELLEQINRSYTQLNNFLQQLNEDQIEQISDKNGWSIKDFIIHIAMWENGICNLLRYEKRWKGMGIEEKIWNSNIDLINDYIRNKFGNLSVKESFKMLDDAHTAIITRIEELEEDDLYLPYNHFESGSEREAPVMTWIIGNTSSHIDPHLEKLKEIFKNSIS